MLYSKHTFIKQGSLTFNDNGKKKFNKSEMRIKDKALMSRESYGEDGIIEDVTVEDNLILGEVDNLLVNNALSKVKKINELLMSIGKDKKTVIYGGGAQTESFISCCNTNSINIIRIVDRNKTMVFGIETADISRENLEDADVIIVTPYFAVNEIKKYIQSLDLNAECLYLADICGEVLFTGHENIWAPDCSSAVNNVNVVKEIDAVKMATKSISEQSSYFATLRYHGQHKSKIKSTNASVEFEKKVGVIIQGPVVSKQQFTFNTIKLYNEIYPNATIILSTWIDDVEADNWKELGLRFELVKSSRPDVRGYQNVNLQLTTTYNGIEKAKQLGLEYAMKTRTDFRFYNPDLIRLMHFFMKKYPISLKNQKERIVIFPPRYDYFFFICDFFMFGNIEDLKEYWSVEPYFTNDYQGESAETMIGIRYSEKIGEKIPNSLDYIKEYRRVIKDRFVVVEDKILDWIWYKYFYNKTWESEYHYNVINFVDWLNMVEGDKQ